MENHTYGQKCLPSVESGKASLPPKHRSLLLLLLSRRHKHKKLLALGSGSFEVKPAQLLPPLLCKGWRAWQCLGLEGKPITPVPTEASSLNEQPWHEVKEKREF